MYNINNYVSNLINNKDKILDIYKIIAVLLIILVILLILVMTSRTRIIKTYDKYMRVGNKANLTGKELALLSKQHLELDELKFAITKNKLGDAYSPKYKTLILSEEVCNTASLASLTIVSHELGHAKQHDENSGLFVFTRLMGNISRITNCLIVPSFVIGLLLFLIKFPNESTGYALIILSAVLLLFHILNQILTIPLEYDASKRALKFLKENNLLSPSEFRKAKKLLSIAAQTYIAGLLDGLFKLKRKK